MNRPLPVGPGMGQLPHRPTPRGPGEVTRVEPARQPGTPARKRPLMRKYEISFLAPDGGSHTLAKLAPANPVFEAPFMALARGTLIGTPQGSIAIEDLEPGMEIATVDQGNMPLLWKGETQLVPGAAGQHEDAGLLTRMLEGSMGFMRPTHDLMLGFGARVWRASRERMVAPTELADGETALTVRPQSAVRVYHIALPRHARITANGIEVESFHPGLAPRRIARPELRQLYLSLFPHLRSLEEFGALNYARDENGHEPLML